MAFPVPKLDDRRFDALVRDSLALVRARCPDWRDLGAGDPGVTLIEVFAFLTENMIYRLNRVPEKLYVALLNLVGAQVRPPSAAAAVLTFSRSGPDNGDIEIPIGTQVGTGDGSVTFMVTDGGVLKRGQQSLNVHALQCEMVDAEPAAVGALQSFRVRKPPIIASSGDDLDVVVGVETRPEDLAGIPSRAYGGKAFAVWRPADSYGQAVEQDRTFVVDRASGLIIFPSGADGAKPPAAGQEVRVWYRRGGGKAGNVAAGALTAVKTPGLKLTVTNEAAAGGGADGETLDSAIRRTPIEASSLRAAITARDFERGATSVGGIARARALALAQVWRHADPGVVQILLVPAIAADTLPEGAVTGDVVLAQRSDELRKRVEQIIDRKRPLGVRVTTDWTKVRPVSVSARVVVTRGEDIGAKAAAIRRRMNQLFSPLNDQLFGRALRASDAYEAILAEPGVRYADGLRFTIGEAPNQNVNDIVRDPHQPRTWFAATNSALHRSLDDTDSWSVVFQAVGEQPRFVRRHGGRPGLVALGTTHTNGSAIHLSRDCGESWSMVAAAFNYDITDATWIERDDKPLMLIATRQGLVQFQPGAGTGPAPVTIDKALDSRGYYAVTASTSPSGAITVAVSARETGGLYLSAAGGVSGTFQPIGLKEKDIRTLVVHRFNARDHLWAAAEAEAAQPGDGAFRLELSANGTSGGDWQPLNIGWQGGTCQGFAFVDGMAFAASNRAGVLRMDTTAATLAWQAMRVDVLSLRDRDRPLGVVTAIAAAPGRPKAVVFAGGAGGVFKSIDGAETFVSASATEFTDRIPLPQDWLYCAASHNITVVEEVEG